VTQGSHRLIEADRHDIVLGTSYDGLNYPYVVYVPTTYDAHTPLPSLLLVHGAGGNGIEFIQYWTTVAEREGIILVGPTLDLGALAETKVPVVLLRLMDAALLNADYFAGAGIFASVIQPDYDSIVQRAANSGECGGAARKAYSQA
jgi:hypothetical protein